MQSFSASMAIRAICREPLHRGRSIVYSAAPADRWHAQGDHIFPQRSQELTARRPEAARAEGLNKPDDPLQHTRLKDPTQPLAFSAKDLNGKLITSTDPEFKGKVLILAIDGSWCPNCHDEAPFLEELYRNYHTRGLDIVELSFEEEDQLVNPQRLRAFIQRYGITYPVLLAGTPDQLNEKLPQVEGLNCWPTTFFIGRNGRVNTIHAGTPDQQRAIATAIFAGK